MKSATYTEVERSLRSLATGRGARSQVAGQFLGDVGVAASGGLTVEGRRLFEQLFVKKTEPREAWRPVALRWPPFRVVTDVFGGCGGVQTRQVADLLTLHGHAQLATRTELTRFLQFGTSLGLFGYRPKKGRVDFPPRGSTPESMEHTVHPSTPLANLRALERIIAACETNVLWLDKHFGARGLDILHDMVSGEQHKHVRLLVGAGENTGEKFRRRAARLTTELHHRDVQLEIRVLPENASRFIHDRWLGDGRAWFNLPPINSVLQGQHGQILETEFDDFDKYWRDASPLVLPSLSTAPVSREPSG